MDKINGTYRGPITPFITGHGAHLVICLCSTLFWASERNKSTERAELLEKDPETDQGII